MSYKKNKTGNKRGHVETVWKKLEGQMGINRIVFQCIHI